MTANTTFNTGISYADNVLNEIFGTQNKTPQQTPPPPPVDYSEAEGLMTQNGTTVELAQIMGEEFQLQQAGLDREMQNAANLEQGLAAFDTKLETSKLDYFQAMKSQSDHHIEKLAAMQPQGSVPDLPPPEEV